MTEIRIGTTKGTFIIQAKSEFSTGEQAVPCPACMHTHKSENGMNDKCGSLNLVKGTYHCNRCDIGGVVITDKTFVDIREKVKAMQITFAKSDLSPMWIQWLREERGISVETAEKMNLHTVVKKLKKVHVPEDYPDREFVVGQYVDSECLAAFYTYNGQLINVQYRDVFKNFAFESGGDLVFFNADVIRRNKVIIITEGWMDAVSCAEAGLWNVISVPNGCTITPDEVKIYERTGQIEILSEPALKYLDNCWDDFTDVEEIVLATDNDAAGQKLLEVLRRRFVNARKTVSKINFRLLPADESKPKKDFNNALKYFGKESVLSLYTRREKFRSVSVITVGDVREEILRHFDEGVPKARKVGWNSLDPHFGYFQGDIIGMNGYPASGKTVVSQNFMAAIAKKFNTRWMIYSPENYPASRFFEALMEIYSGKSMRKGEGSFTPDDPLFKDAFEWVNEYFRVANKRTAFTLPELRELAVEENCQGLFVDPWNRLVRDKKHRGVVISDYIQEELTEQIAYGLDTNITTWISVHPPTQDKISRKGNEDGSFNHPTAYEIEGGKVWFSSLHALICTHRPNASDMGSKATHIFTQKLKDWGLYGLPTGDKSPLEFKMLNAKNKRLYLNGQSPLDDNAPEQLNLYEQRSITTTAGNFSKPDDLPF
jgi:Toprim-like